MSLRKTLRFRVRLQLSQSRCLSLLLAMSDRVFLFLPPRGHEPPPTLRDRLNPNLSLYGECCTLRYRIDITRANQKPLLHITRTNHLAHLAVFDIVINLRRLNFSAGKLQQALFSHPSASIALNIWPLG